MEAAAVTAQWARIESFLQNHSKVEHPFLNPGATEEQIAAAEAELGGIRFPDAYRASLQRHNGQAAELILLGQVGSLLSTEDTVDQWRVWKELLDAGTFADDDADTTPGEGVKACWWNPRWIPITHDGGGDHDCLDLDPAEGGNVGQIIQMWHDDGPRPLVAKGFLVWLQDCADRLEDGRVAWDPDCGFVAKSSD